MSFITIIYSFDLKLRGPKLLNTKIRKIIFRVAFLMILITN